VPYFTVGSSYRRLWVSDAILIGSSPADKGCQHSNFCRAQLTSDPWHSRCNSIFAPANFRRVGYVVPFNTNFKQTCLFSLDERMCRQARGTAKERSGSAACSSRDTRFQLGRDIRCDVGHPCLAPRGLPGLHRLRLRFPR